MVLLAVLFALVVVFMVLSPWWSSARKKGETGDGEHFEGNGALEIAWTLLPLIAWVSSRYLGVTTLHTITAAQDNEVVVDVEGFQWAWAFTYPDRAASADLVLPVGRPA